MQNLVDLFKERRRELGWSVREVAEHAGYGGGNLSKGMRKYQMIEDAKRGFPRETILEVFAPVLDIAQDEIDETIKQDLIELDRPVPPQLIVRIIPAVYMPAPLPEGCSRAKAERIAQKLSVIEGCICWVQVTGLRAIMFKPDGTVSESLGLPHSSLFDRFRSLLPAGTDSKLQISAVRAHQRVYHDADAMG